MKLRCKNKMMCSGAIRGNKAKFKRMRGFVVKWMLRITGFTCIHSFICHRSGGTMDDNSLNVSNVKVAVRVRPMNRRGEYNVSQILWQSLKAVLSWTIQPLISLFFIGHHKVFLPCSKGTRVQYSTLPVFLVGFWKDLFCPSLKRFWLKWCGIGNGKIWERQWHHILTEKGL